MARDLEDFPIEPDEAKDLALHVKNCMRRHTALVRMIRHDRILTWLYRAALLPSVGYLIHKMGGIG